MFEHVLCPIFAHVLAVVEFSICEICVSKICLASQTMSGLGGWRSLFESHLLTYGMVFVAREMCPLLYYLCMHVLGLHTSCHVGWM
jgi:hypothetical protein